MATTRDHQLRSLVGLTGLFVELARTDEWEKVTGVGVPELNTLRTVVEKNLAHGGIKLLTRGECRQEPGSPYLEFTFDAFSLDHVAFSPFEDTTTVCCWMCHIRLFQDATPERQSGMAAITVVTWEMFFGGTGYSDGVYTDAVAPLTEKTNRFIDDWKEAQRVAGYYERSFEQSPASISSKKSES